MYISFASATDHFWILHDHAVVTVIDEKLQALNLDDNAEFVLNENPVVGGLYAVFHSVYGNLFFTCEICYFSRAQLCSTENWFRGRVVSTDTTKCLASILFVDYGDSQDTKFDKIRELPESLASIPPCARECKCLTLGQDRSMWTEEAAEALTEICTLGTPVEAVFNTKSEAGASEIESLHLNGHNVIDLINRRLAGESLQSVVSAQSNERSRDQQASLS